LPAALGAAVLFDVAVAPLLLVAGLLTVGGFAEAVVFATGAGFSGRAGFDASGGDDFFACTAAMLCESEPELVACNGGVPLLVVSPVAASLLTACWRKSALDVGADLSRESSERGGGRLT
jgi:hypothetical protein